MQLLHLGLALGSKSLSHLFLRLGLEPLHPLVLLELLLGHAQGRGSLCHLLDLLVVCCFCMLLLLLLKLCCMLLSSCCCIILDCSSYKRCCSICICIWLLV